MAGDMDFIRLPAEIEAFGKKGKLIGVSPRTRCTRIFVIEWEDGEIKRYKGASTRPSWIKHIKQAPYIEED